MRDKIALAGILICFLLLNSLGFWQLSRAHEKEQMLALFKSRMHQRLSVHELGKSPAELEYSAVELMGSFEKNTDILLMHQTNEKGQPGYAVLTLFKAEGLKQAVWVNRGFLPLSEKHKIPSPLFEKQVIHGIIMIPQTDRFILGENILLPEQRPLEMQRVDWMEMMAFAKQPAMPWIFQATGDLQDHLLREPPMVVAMPPEKHKAYAVQWFALAFCLAFITMSYYRRKNKMTDKIKRKKALSLTLLLIIFLAPFIGAIFIYQARDGLHFMTKNAGQLIRPSVSLQELGIAEPQEPRWWMVYSQPEGDCQAACKKVIAHFQQIRESLVREAPRLGIAILVQQSGAQPQSIPEAVDAVWVAAQPLPDGLPRQMSQGIWLVDPLGNIILSYDVEVLDNRMLLDLRHLLKVSQIG